MSLHRFAAAAALVFAASSAAASSVNFEEFSQNDLVTSLSIGPVTATVTSSGAPQGARIFDTNNPNSLDLDLGAPFAEADGGPDLSPGNILVGAGNGGGTPLPNDDVGSTITFTFDAPVFFSGITVFDIEEEVSLLVDGILFASGLNTVPTVGGGNGDNLYRAYSFAPVRIASTLAVVNTGSGGFDDLHIAPVPVPAALPMLLGALGLTGFMARRRRG